MPQVSFDIIGRDKASGAFNSVSASADKTSGHLSRISEGFKNVAKVAALAVGGAALGGVVAVFKTGIDEQKDFLAGQAQLAAGIKSTGNAAHVSVGGLEDMASSIQNFSGQTDDSIVASEKLLLTFTNVRNEVGKGNDIFNQATQATADMAAKMGGDASTYAVQLGKALNDPIKGITALTRIGVSFTEGQKKQIKTLVDSGHTMQAQKIILGELNREFGGAAKAAGDTLPGQLARAKRAFEDIAQSVLAALMPILVRVATFISKTLMPAFGGLISAIQGEGITSDGFVGFMERIGVAIRAVWLTAKDVWPKIVALIQAEWEHIAKPVITALWSFLTQRLIPAFKAVVQWVVAHWPQIRAALVAAWQAIKPVLQSLGALLTTVWKSVLKPIVDWVKRNWPAISTVAKVVFITVAVLAKALAVTLTLTFKALGVTIRATAAVFGFLDRAFRATYEAIKAIGSLLVRFFADLRTRITGIFANAINWLVNAGRGIITGLWRGVSSLGSWFVGQVRRIPTWVVGVFAGAAGWLVAGGRNILRGLWSGISALGGWLVGRIKSIIPGWIKTALGIKSPPQWAKDFGGWIAKGLAFGITHRFPKLLGNLAGVARRALGSVIGGISIGGGVDLKGQIPTLLQKIAQDLLPAYGMAKDQIGALIQLWNGESGWRWNATNPTSGAYGIPQALPAGKMASAGADWQTNALTQIKWGLGYIKDRYGTPNNAYAQWLSRSPHWYKEGAWSIPADQLAFLHKREMVVPADKADKFRAGASLGGTVNYYYITVPYGGAAAGREVVRLLEEYPGQINIAQKVRG